MRNIYLLWGLLTCIAFTSCYEEDALTPTEGGIELRFKVPQGTNSWDDDISQIQKDFGVYLIYKDLQDEDFNRSWTAPAPPWPSAISPPEKPTLPPARGRTGWSM